MRNKRGNNSLRFFLFIADPATNSRLSKNFSFWKATSDFIEKAGDRPLFQELFPKLTEFWKKLTLLSSFAGLCMSRGGS
jgi:hypothetical protein